jgi:hypothetical protein
VGVVWYREMHELEKGTGHLSLLLLCLDRLRRRSSTVYIAIAQRVGHSLLCSLAIELDAIDAEIVVLVHVLANEGEQSITSSIEFNRCSATNEPVESERGKSYLNQPLHSTTFLCRQSVDSPKKVLFANIASNQVIAVLYQAISRQTNEQESIFVLTPSFALCSAVAIVNLELLLW